MKNFYTAALFFLGLGLSQAQVYDTGSLVFMKDVSNNGVAVGSLGGSHVLWTVNSGTISLGEIQSGQASGMTNVSSDGRYVSGTMTNPNTGVDEMARYDTTTQTWTYLGTISAGSESSAWGMTSDGSTVVGLGLLESYLGNAVKWSQTTGFVTIGSTVSGSSSRANAISDDGTIVAGWQDDDYGDRFGVYWKDGVQTYIKDNNGDLVGEVANMTPDGKTMVGTNLERPYIWNETTGYTEFIHDNPMYEGGASAISDDGKTVIGFFREWGTGALSGEGFIWNQEKGRINLNEYVTSLGLDDLGMTFALPMAISPNGKYIVGIGRIDNDYQGFVIDLSAVLATKDVAMSKTKIYPNPVGNFLQITNSEKITGVEIYNMAGQKVLSTAKISKDGLNVSTLTKGTYVVKVKNATSAESIKMLKK